MPIAPAAVASDSFVKYQEQLGAYRLEKLDAIHEQQAAKDKEAQDKAEELGIGDLQDISNQIAKGFHPEVEKAYNQTLGKIYDIYQTPGRTNVQRYAEMEKSIADFGSQMKPMIATTQAMNQAVNTPSEKLNAEQKESIAGGIPHLAQQFLDGSIDWKEFTKAMTPVPNALNSYSLDPTGYGFKMNQQEIDNPDDLIKKGSKGNILDLVTKYVKPIMEPVLDASGKASLDANKQPIMRPATKIDEEKGLTYEQMQISDEDAEKLAKTLMSTDPRLHPGGSLFNGFLNAGYYDKGADGQMKYTTPQYDEQGNLIHIAAKPVGDMSNEMQKDLVSMIKLAGTQALVKPIGAYSDFATQQKMRVAAAGAANKANNQPYSEAPIINAYVGDITKKQEEAKKQLSDVEKQRKTALNSITGDLTEDQYKAEQDKVNAEYNKKAQPLQSEYDTYTNQIDLLNNKNAYLNGKGITNQTLLKALHQQIDNPNESLEDFKKKVDKQTKTKSDDNKKDDVDQYFRK